MRRISSPQTYTADTNWTQTPYAISNAAAIEFGAQYIPTAGTTGTDTRLTVPAAALGLKTVRIGGSTWDRIEQVSGQYQGGNAAVTNSDLIGLNSAVASATAAGMSPIVGLGTFPSNPSVHGGEFGNGEIGSCPHFVAANQAWVGYLGSNCSRYEFTNEDNTSVSGNPALFSLRCCANTYDGASVGSPSSTKALSAMFDPASYVSWMASMTTTALSDGRKWNNLASVFSWHLYGSVPSGANKTPEYLGYLGLRSCTIITGALGATGIPNDTAYIANPRFWITEFGGWPNAVSPGVVTQAVAAQYCSRMPFMVGCMPGVELASFYAIHDDGAGFQQGLYTGGGVAKLQAATYRDAIAHLNISYQRAWYRHGVQDAHTVAMRMLDGSTRYAVWGSTWQWSSGFVNGADASGNVTFTIISPAGGTLQIQTIGSTTSTALLNAGQNLVTIAYSPTAVVFWALDVSSHTMAIVVSGCPI